MQQPIATLIAALVAATATAAGWVVSYAYGRRRDAQAKELELRVRYRQRQIEELYGPLFSLIEQVFSAAEVQDRILPEEKAALNDVDQDRVRRFFWEQQSRRCIGRSASCCARSSTSSKAPSFPKASLSTSSMPLRRSASVGCGTSPA